MYQYKSIVNLTYGEYFMFANGQTINIVTYKERNLLIYKNILTGKFRRVKGFVDWDKSVNYPKHCRVTFVKMLTRTFEKMIEDRIEQSNMPF